MLQNQAGGYSMSEIAPFIIKIKPYLTQSIVLSEVMSIKLVVPSTHMLIPYALEKISAGFPLQHKIMSIKRSI